MPNTKFDSKSFNPQAFKYIVDRVPNLNKTEIRKSRALKSNPDIKNVFSTQNGTEYARLAMRGLLDGQAVNYDGQTDIIATSTKTFERGVVAIGRAKSWVEKDFSFDITGGVDFLDSAAAQVAEYFFGVDEATLLSILSGIFSMSGDEKSREFVAKHTLDLTGETDKNIGVTSVNTATNKACGANKQKFKLIFMHSDVATNVENLNLLQHLKYTDKDGVTRDLDLGTLNGKTVIISDFMPLMRTVTTAETKGVYTITIGTKGIAGDKIDVGGTEYTFATSSSYSNKTIAVGSSANTQATQLATLLAQQYAGVFSVESSTNTVVLTQIIGGSGSAPAVTATQTTDGTIVASIATTTAGVAEVSVTDYITYILGEGAFDYEDLGAKVPYEVQRDAKTNGGEDYLYSRQRKCFAPYGISYEKVNQRTLSPEDDELADGRNWALVHSGEVNEEDRTYINHKAIPIARIISRG